MASFKEYTGDGVTRRFPVQFQYLAPSHVRFQVDGVDVEFDLITPGEVELAAGEPTPPNGAYIRIFRETPREPLVDFAPGVLTQQDLDLAVAQSVFLAEEAIDVTANGLFVDPLTGAIDAGGRRIENVAVPQNTDDVATKQWSDDQAQSRLGQALTAANNATTQAGIATTKADEAAASATASAQARDESQAARDSASGHRLNAQNAKNAAEDARDVTLQARDETLTARDVTIGARDVATGARDVAINKRDEAETFRNEALSFRNEAETFRNEAQTFDPATVVPLSMVGTDEGQIPTLGAGGVLPTSVVPMPGAASTSEAGIVQLNNSVTSTSTTQAATANAAKVAYDRGTTALNTANSKMNTDPGTLGVGATAMVRRWNSWGQADAGAVLAGSGLITISLTPQQDPQSGNMYLTITSVNLLSGTWRVMNYLTDKVVGMARRIA